MKLHEVKKGERAIIWKRLAVRDCIGKELEDGTRILDPGYDLNFFGDHSEMSKIEIVVGRPQEWAYAKLKELCGYEPSGRFEGII